MRAGRNILFCAFLMLALALMPHSASAETTASRYTAKYFIEYGMVVADISAEFDEPVTGKFVFELPLDAKGIVAYVDREEAGLSLVGNKAVISLENSTSFSLEYISRSEVAGKELLTTVQFPFAADAVLVKLSLPSGARLTVPVQQATQERAILPRPDDVYTDGQNIGIEWRFRNRVAGDEIPIFAEYMIPATAWIYWLIAVIVAFLAVIAVLFFIILRLRRNKDEPDRPKQVEKQESGPEAYEKHLKESEQQIINVLKLKEGSCSQGTLRVATGFSKAKLSALLKEMEDRKLVHKEKRGNKNLVSLKR